MIQLDVAKTAQKKKLPEGQNSSSYFHDLLFGTKPKVPDAAAYVSKFSGAESKALLPYLGKKEENSAAVEAALAGLTEKRKTDPASALIANGLEMFSSHELKNALVGIHTDTAIPEKEKSALVNELWSVADSLGAFEVPRSPVGSFDNIGRNTTGITVIHHHFTPLDESYTAKEDTQ